MRIQVQYGQNVSVDEFWFGYTYTCNEHVEVGDIVEVPPGPQFATVVALGSDYDGVTDPIVRVVERRPSCRRRLGGGV